jgi:hypothetical protein
MPTELQDIELGFAPQREMRAELPEFEFRDVQGELDMLAALAPAQQGQFDFMRGGLAAAAQAGAGRPSWDTGALIAAMGGAFGGTTQQMEVDNETAQRQYLMNLLSHRLEGDNENRVARNAVADRQYDWDAANQDIDFTNRAAQNELDRQELTFNTERRDSNTTRRDAALANQFMLGVELSQAAAETDNRERQFNAGQRQAYESALMQTRQFNASQASQDFWNTARFNEDSRRYATDFNEGSRRYDQTRTDNQAALADERAARDAQQQRLSGGMSTRGQSLLQSVTGLDMSTNVQLGNIRTVQAAATMGNGIVPWDDLVADVANYPQVMEAVGGSTRRRLENVQGTDPAQVEAARTQILLEWVGTDQQRRQQILALGAAGNSQVARVIQQGTQR